ncbi:MAG: CDGSH iron-sulfur domain-containing protein [Actinomycetota bacterium]
MTDTEAANDAPPTPQVSMFENGPIQVAGGVPLVRRQIVKTEHGEPVAYRTTEEVDAADPYFLCRCGESDNKPFCDGSHKPAGFESDEPDLGEYAGRADELGGLKITISDDRGICVHAGFCGNQATNVWKMVSDVDDDTLVRARAIEMVERCPSGALTYTLEGDGEANEPSLPVEIAILDDGPLYLTGGIPVSRSDGEELETRNRVTLCRCGASAKKPLCDGSHGDAGFRDPS